MPRGRPRAGSDYVPRIRVNFRLEPEVAKALERVAKRQKLSRNTYVDRVLRAALEADGLLPKKSL
jgi:uncharacterized protein (DUF1778 family)